MREFCVPLSIVVVEHGGAVSPSFRFFSRGGDKGHFLDFLAEVSLVDRNSKDLLISIEL